MRYVESLGVAEVVADDITVLRLDEVEELSEDDDEDARLVKYSQQRLAQEILARLAHHPARAHAATRASSWSR